MKLVKRISYFFVIPIFFLSLGIFIGVWGIRFFYPGSYRGSYPGRYSEVPADRADTSEVPENVAVTVSEETLCADTEYVLKETDILRNTSVETSWQIPHKYIGMTRERFLETMNLYAEHPPLSELERGFVGLEVLSFSREKVVVRMDYRYLQPSDGFYLAGCDNEVVVYLEVGLPYISIQGLPWTVFRRKYRCRLWTYCPFLMRKHCMIFWRHILPEERNR